MSIRFVSHSPEDTLCFAKKLAEGKCEGIEVEKGSVFLLVGEVGAGKTTFVKGFASFWCLEEEVSSPTFTIMNEYKNDNVKILHSDLYRLFNSEEVYELGLEEFIAENDYSFIEWPEKAMPLLNLKPLIVRIEVGEAETERVFVVE